MPPANLVFTRLRQEIKTQAPPAVLDETK